jgi:biotin-dependent carboxylase-like uncharacterized protein
VTPGTGLEIIRPGLFTTVQDLGRFGCQRYGVPVSGAMDLFALRAANRLVGNPDGAAGLEVTFGDFELRALGPAIVAITGAAVDPRRHHDRLPMWSTVALDDGEVLRLGGPPDGARAYLAVRGGIDVPLVLGSRSTYTRSRLGGFEGRRLETGDRLPVGAAPGRTVRFRRLDATRIPRYGAHHLVRVVPGPQDDRFTADGWQTFVASTWRVSVRSDRTGCRLEGPAITHAASPDIVSDGSPFGAIQVAGDGQPIVLLADRGTAGGYTKIATVASADLMHLAQALPGHLVVVQPVTVDEARQALLDLECRLDAISPRLG